jgi:hypothetical protein
VVRDCKRQVANFKREVAHLNVSVGDWSLAVPQRTIVMMRANNSGCAL